MPAPADGNRGRLGSTQVAVTLLGFGGTGIGNLFRAVESEVAELTVTAAWEGGVRFFDTAPLYGLGLSEERLGRALRRHPRESYVLSSKVGRLIVPNPTPVGVRRRAGLFDVPDDDEARHDYSTDGVLRSVDASLRRLGVDRLDIVLVHDPDDHLPQALTEAIPALARLRDEGVVGAIGAGMNKWQALKRIVEQADVDVVMVAGRWTLIDRSAALLLDVCLERGVSVLAAAPYNSGLLAASEPPDDATFDYAQAAPEKLALARRLAALAREHGTTLPAAALQAPLRHPAVAAVVPGMASPAEARDAVARMTAPIPDDFWSAAAEELKPKGTSPQR